MLLNQFFAWLLGQDRLKLNPEPKLLVLFEMRARNFRVDKADLGDYAIAYKTGTLVHRISRIPWSKGERVMTLEVARCNKEPKLNKCYCHVAITKCSVFVSHYL